ncbi:hypothetical protein D9611_000586 [Ephemerocybe angulata]|uniref:Uncharacterized protein n=1 Tax=Ephemerocybe angulata TaxID=980116 RepID=A0A8H5F6Z5_9AGAR|nr:hypothetical protein D9611_000586 [Tulosesus angulatus]
MPSESDNQPSRAFAQGLDKIMEQGTPSNPTKAELVAHTFQAGAIAQTSIGNVESASSTTDSSEKAVSDSSALRTEAETTMNLGSQSPVHIGRADNVTVNWATPLGFSPAQSPPQPEEEEADPFAVTPNETYKGVSGPLEDKLSKAIQGFMSNGYSRLLPPSAPEATAAKA